MYVKQLTPSLCNVQNNILFHRLQVVIKTRVILSAILCSSAFFTGAAESSTEFPLDKIFWPAPKIEELHDILVVAFFKDENHE